jgi:hypothetical protein
MGKKNMLEYYFYINSSNMVVGLGKENLLKMLYCAICRLVIVSGTQLSRLSFLSLTTSNTDGEIEIQG